MTLRLLIMMHFGNTQLNFRILSILATTGWEHLYSCMVVIFCYHLQFLSENSLRVYLFSLRTMVWFYD